MRTAPALLATAASAVVAGGAAAGEAQAPPTLRMPDDARVTIVGESFAPGFPRSTLLEPAGDVNGDGRRDLVVLNRQEHAGDETRSYLLFGGRLPARVQLDRLGRSGLALLRSRAGDRVVAAGDVNGDERADLVRCSAATGSVQVLLGGTRRGDTIVGAACEAQPGDVDGNGLADLLVHRFRRDGWLTATIVFATRGARRTIDVARAGRSGFHVSAGRFADVTPLGDVNGDGRADLGVSRSRGSSAQLALVFGRSRTGTVDVTRATLPLVTGSGFVRFGPAGDVDGDGVDDLAVAEQGVRVCIVFGRRGAWPGRSGCTATRGLVVRASEGRDPVGFPFAPAGDVDGDGYDDLLVFATTRASATVAPGTVYLVHGRPTPGRILLPADGRTVAVTGGASLGEGWAAGLAGPGDVTGDGRADVVLGSGWSGDAWILSPPKR